MTDALPPPFTPPDADLRDFKFMPLHVARFAKSGLVTLEEPAAIVAAILLWGASWHEVPAGSLVDDDKQLAQLAGYGRAVDAWREVRTAALRGWVKCSDGRLYHPVVAEMVEDAWRGKLKQRWRTYSNAIRQHNGRNPDDQRDSPTFEDWLEHGRPTTVVRGRTRPQQNEFDLDADDDSRARPRSGAHARVSGEGNVTGDNGDESRVTTGNVTGDMGGESRSSHTENGSKGQGQGQGQRDSESPPKPPKPEAILDLTSRLANAGGVSIVQPRRLTAALDLVKRWIGDGIDVEETILPTIAKRLADMAPSDTVGSLTYFDAAIRKAHALKAGGRRGEAPAPGKPIDDVDDDDERVARIREKLRRSVNARTYDGWLGPRITAMHINGVGLIVKAQTAFNADWIVNHFSGALSEAAKGEGIEAVRVEPI